MNYYLYEYSGDPTLACACSCVEKIASCQIECEGKVNQVMSEMVTKDLQLEAIQDERDKWRETAHIATRELDR